MEDIKLKFEAKGQGAKDEQVIVIPMRTDRLAITTAPNNYALDNTMKVCYFLANKEDKIKDRLEIEFELFVQLLISLELPN